MSYYSDLKKHDVVEWMKPLIEARTYSCRRSDGKFEMQHGQEPYDSPWHHVNYSEGAVCPYLHGQLFNVISPRTPIGRFVPRRCHECWKIVIRPKSLKQLFALEDLLIHMGLPSKCGIEKRSYTPLSKYRYGGYIYNRSYDEGIENLKRLREVLKNSKPLSDVECYLKRACTEMEMAFPNSHEWKITQEQHAIEDMLDWLLVYDIQASMVSQHILDKIHMGWVEWAAENGDETYLEYTDGNSLYPGVVKYELPVEGTEAGSPDDKTVAPSPTAGEVPKGKSQRTTKEKK